MDHTTGGECTVNWMEGDIVHSIDKRLILRGRGLVSSMTFEREIIPINRMTISME